jgi:hypothetical protein
MPQCVNCGGPVPGCTAAGDPPPFCSDACAAQWGRDSWHAFMRWDVQSQEWLPTDPKSPFYDALAFDLVAHETE